MKLAPLKARPRIQRLGHLYYIWTLFAAICWVLDQHLCTWLNDTHFNPQLHGTGVRDVHSFAENKCLGWWHLAGGFASYCGILHVSAAHAFARGGEVDLHFMAGLIPVLQDRNQK